MRAGGAMSRRRLLELLASGAALTGCDRIRVDVQTDLDGDIEPITPIGSFYVYQHTFAPTVDPVAWRLRVGAPGGSIEIDADWLAAREPVEIEHTLQCIGGNPRNALIGNAVWEGLPFAEILDALEIAVGPEIVELRFEGADGYHTSIPVGDLQDDRLWLVWRMNGEALPAEHGAPARFLVRGRYGTKNVKWPVAVDLLDAPYTGYWEQVGWSNDARYRANGFIFAPVDGATVPGPTVDLVGTAYAGDDPITRVEITFDDGVTWADTELYYAPGPNVWALWRFRLDGASGTVTAAVRVSTAAGVQSVGPDGTDQLLGYDGGMRVRFAVDG